ncbi:asparaginase [Paenibacillus pasadenensis]|uniref:asparaginase n=1 Tax=Paenibacillus pasadenensis TaxID=217090 RepID=UPI00203E6068|nr:asparaginase [Paenibacillus pasadenensis]MCM3748317.1 asparaginase [Paenibacillus pasadenensis]
MESIQQRFPGVPLSGTTRGQWTENLHTGFAAIVSARQPERPLAAAGDSEAMVFMRSTAKPIQAAAGITAGLMEHYGLPEASIALMSASHRGGPEHIELLERMLELTGVREEQLAFGDDLPLGPIERDYAMRSGFGPRKLYHTCSGKHIGLLAYCRMMGWPMEGYTDSGHPLQAKLLESVAAYTGMEQSSIGRAIDGCGLPVFRMPLSRLALAYAKLGDVSPAAEAAGPLSAASRIAAAMQAWPEMVEGEGRLATVLLQRGIVAKSGAQGVFALAVPAAAIGAAVQVDDGGESAWPVIVAELLDQLRLHLNEAGVPEDRQPELERQLSGAAEAVRGQFPERMFSSTGAETGARQALLQLNWA